MGLSEDLKPLDRFDYILRGRGGWFLLGEGFQGAGYYLFGRVVATSAEVRRDELLTVRVEVQGEGHGSL